MTPSGQLFVTGMLRSGTSLLQTLLTNHSQLFVAYQPFSQFYLDVKQLFLDEEGINRLLPLGDGSDGPPDEPERFQCWLEQTVFESERVEQLVRSGVRGKGGSCAALAEELPISGRYFGEIHAALHDALAQRFGKAKVKWRGSKEILCEEYLPYLLEQKRHCLLIVRDPRAVVASASNGRYRDMVGDCYPMLMLARIWRKSVAYALALGNSPFLRVMRYEDLVRSTEAELHRIARFLRIDDFPGNMLKGGRLLDHTGQAWAGNSSFGEKSFVDDLSVESWDRHLAAPEIELVEALCYPEMLAMGYLPGLRVSDCPHVIESFVENPEGLRPLYWEHYALDHAQRQRELLRLEDLRKLSPLGDSDNVPLWQSVRKKLSQILRTEPDAS